MHFMQSGMMHIEIWACPKKIQKVQPQICSGCPLPTKALVAAC